MRALILKDGEGETLAGGGFSITYKTRSEMTNDAVGIYEITLAAGSPGAGLHFHKIMTEMFHVLSGTLSMTIDGETIEAGPNTYVHVPPGVVHSFSNRGSEPARFMLTFTPALAREGFFEGLLKLAKEQRLGDQSAMLELMEKYDQYPTSGVEGWSGGR